VSSRDPEAVVRLFAPEGTIEDPVGNPPHVGRDGVGEMFKAAFDAAAEGSSLDFRVDGHISVAGRVAVAPLLVDWHGPKRTKRIRAVDVIEFDERCRITSVKAYWGASDVEVLA
jgi:steroid delta-isomerase